MIKCRDKAIFVIMIEAFVVYNDPEQIAHLQKSDEIKITTLDEMRYRERRLAFKVKGSVAARLTPLIVIKFDGRIGKAFYREAYQDPVAEFNKWLDDYNKCERLDLSKMFIK